jgi:hypothetical protein
VKTADRTLLPRLVRLRDAPFYLGMDRNRFVKEVRPYLTAIPIGKQGVAFDRLELDDWIEQYKARNGRPGELVGDSLWDEKERLDSVGEKASGTSTSTSTGGEFARVLDTLSLKKQKLSLPKSSKSKGKRKYSG